MKLKTERNFEKSYRQLAPSDQKRVDKAMETFKRDPRDPRLRDHPLRGQHQGERSICVGSFLRILYILEKTQEDVRAVLMDIGTHREVYEKEYKPRKNKLYS